MGSNAYRTSHNPPTPELLDACDRLGMLVMDRGIPTEAVLEELRRSDAKVSYLVGTPKGRLTKLEKELSEKPWQEVRPQLRVKLLPQDGEVYVLAQSGARTAKERAMRRRKLQALWQRLHELQQQDLTRD